MSPFVIQKPSSPEVPIVLSIPHCGTEFPPEIISDYQPHLISQPDDTDWFVHQLYNFASELGITTIHAVYSRWVIDLNRDPKSKPLYNDGRIITDLCPTTTFVGEPLYLDERKQVDSIEVQRRVDQYYLPYHQMVQQILDNLKKKFEKVLLWDCHSIRQLVPTIQADKFPDLILGSADGTSASPALIETTIKNLESTTYSFRHNFPFKGGYITRNFGRPSENQHALQLEMTKILYMDDSEMQYHTERASRVQHLLKQTFRELTTQLLN